MSSYLHLLGDRTGTRTLMKEPEPMLQIWPIRIATHRHDSLLLLQNSSGSVSRPAITICLLPSLGSVAAFQGPESFFSAIAAAGCVDAILDSSSRAWTTVDTVIRNFAVVFIGAHKVRNEGWHSPQREKIVIRLRQ
ncbi:hypothetical protein CRV24_000419 [Beauveria bassiana]|nr:hypothetical protein CRV24_000419 [Beauveria bassiana]